MATFTPPVAVKVTPRFCPDSTPTQKALFKHARPLDCQVNTYIWSDGTVTTDLPVTLSDASQSSTVLHLPDDVPASATVGPPEGASGGPYGPPPPYASVTDFLQNPPVTTNSVTSPYLKYWFQAGAAYAGISANLVALLTAAKFDNFLS